MFRSITSKSVLLILVLLWPASSGAVLEFGGGVSAGGGGGATWPNEPAGTTLTDQNFNSMTSPAGWNVAFNGTCQIVSHALSGAVSPSNVLEMSRTVSGGGCKEYFVLDHTKLYIGAYWQPSNPFDGWLNEFNKLFVLQSTATSGDGSSLWTEMHGDSSSGPFRISFLVEGIGVDNSHTGACGSFTSCVFFSSPVITLGSPHKIEQYTKRSTTETSRDGICKIWLDGTLVINLTNLNIASGNFYEFTIGPSWDGPPDAPFTQAIHEWDHVKLSVPTN